MNEIERFVAHRIEATLGRTPKSIELLPEGITHRNYLVDGKYVYKRKNPLRQPFYNADADFHANTLMASLTYGPRILYFSKEDNEIIYEFLPGTTRLTLPVDDNALKAVADTLYKLHTSNITLPNTFNLGEMIKYYKENRAPIYPDESFETKIIAKYEDYHKQATLVPCHNDVVRGNLLFRESHLTLIDYEYAGMNDPLFDHISFLSENNLDDEDTVKRYFAFVKDIPRPLDENKVLTYVLAMDLLWFYWGGYLYELTSEQIFKDISDEKAARISMRRNKLNL